MPYIANVFMNILPPFVVLGILIFIHEFGHFIVAKLSGVCVEQFSIGFGPEIFKVKKGDTLYSIAMIPFGGFVKMAGESYEDLKGKEPSKRDFLGQPLLNRFLIVFAGPLMNYFLAFVFLIIAFMAGAPSFQAVIGETIEGYPADVSGIMGGDKVLSVNGAEVNSWPEMQHAIFSAEGESVSLEILRGDKIITLNVPLFEKSADDGKGGKKTYKVIGVMPKIIKGDIIHSVVLSGKSIFFLTEHIFRSLGKLITGKVSPKQLSGPLGIMIISSKVAKKGLIDLIVFTAFLSVSLAVFNLLPIPALDGGHIFFMLLEAIMGRPVSFELQGKIAQGGFIFLMCLMVLIIYNDVLNNADFFAKIKNMIPFLK